MRSLLFGAVLSDGGDGNSADLPSLACGSDTEEDGGSEETQVAPTANLKQRMHGRYCKM